MFDFQYRTPWVDRNRFPDGLSVLCAYHRDRLIAFLGAIAAPYPFATSYWLSLWHALPVLGMGMGIELMRAFRKIAADDQAWIGTFGAGPEAVGHYRREAFEVQPVRRWQWTGERSAPKPVHHFARYENRPSPEWIDYRFRRHPHFTYEFRGDSIFRIDRNEWGRVIHAIRLGDDHYNHAADIHDFTRPRLMDAWGLQCPGPGWEPAGADIPTVFHPPTIRGNTIYAAGWPRLPCTIEKGDCDQDRPN